MRINISFKNNYKYHFQKFTFKKKRYLKEKMNQTHLTIILLTTVLSLGGLYYFTSQKQSTDSEVETRLYNSFVNWKLQYNKIYDSTEESLRYSIYKSNVAKIVDHNNRANSGEFTFVLNVNQFADLTQDEFKSIYLGTKSPVKTTNYKPLPTVNLPASVDWRTNQAVSDVKNQGSCGSCWAFSAIGALEGLHAIKTKQLTQFSEQELVDCSTSFGNEGCNGGLMDLAFQYVVKNGIETESDYPYSGSDDKCATVSSKTHWKINGFNDVPQNVSSQLKAAIAQQPVSVAIEADGFWFQFYFGGIFNSSCGTDLDHGVLAVGYGSENGQNYWIVKNSWGGSWGESGYIRIADNGDGPGLCGIQMSASYPTV